GEEQFGGLVPVNLFADEGGEMGPDVVDLAVEHRRRHDRTPGASALVAPRSLRPDYPGRHELVHIPFTLSPIASRSGSRPGWGTHPPWGGTHRNPDGVGLDPGTAWSHRRHDRSEGASWTPPCDN